MALVQALLVRDQGNTADSLTATMTRYVDKVTCSECPQTYFLDYQAQSVNSIPDGLIKLIEAAQTVATRQHNANHQMSTVPVNQI
jgi:hypothetical protein